MTAGSTYGTSPLTADINYRSLQNSGGSGSTVYKYRYVNGANYTITATTIQPKPQEPYL